MESKLSFNELALTFKDIIDALFKSHGFECKKLYYGKDIYYCARDILACLGYSLNRKAIHDVILKLNDSHKFTIKDLQEKYLQSPINISPESENESSFNQDADDESESDSKSLKDPNQSLINSLTYNEIRNVYVNKQALYRLIGSSKKIEAKPFQDFVYDILLPSLDNHYEEIVKKKNLELIEMEQLNKAILNELREIKNINMKFSKQLQTVEESNNDLSEKLDDVHEEIRETKNEIEETNNNLIELKNEQVELITQIEENIIPEQKPSQSNDNFRHYFVMYRKTDNTFGLVRGMKPYLIRKLKNIKLSDIVINHKYTESIDFGNLFKEEVKKRNYFLRQDIIQAFKKVNPKFRVTSFEGKKMIEEELNRLKGFSLKANVLSLNNSKLEDVLDFYNLLIKNKEAY